MPIFEAVVADGGPVAADDVGEAAVVEGCTHSASQEGESGGPGCLCSDDFFRGGGDARRRILMVQCLPFTVWGTT